MNMEYTYSVHMGLQVAVPLSGKLFI